MMGVCAGCGAGIPWGWLVVEMPPTERASLVRRLNGAFQTVLRKVDLYCRRCPQSQEVSLDIKRHRRRHLADEEVEVPTLSARELAIKLVKALDETPVSSNKLLERAGLDEDYKEPAIGILRLLAKADKIKKVKTEEGGVRWCSI